MKLWRLCSGSILPLVAMLCLIGFWPINAGWAQNTTAPAPATAAAETAPLPPQAEQLLKLLDDPVLRDWLAQHGKATGAAAAPTTDAQPPAMEMSPGNYISGRIAGIRQHLETLVLTVPRLPGELSQAWTILHFEFEESGVQRLVVLIGGFLALGYFCEYLFRRATRGLQKWIISVPLDSVGERARTAGIRLLFALGLVICFTIGSVGTFLAFDWPPLLREIVLGYLLAFLILRVALVISRFLLAPGGERFRLIPMSSPAAWFWYRRIGLFVGWLATGWVTVGILNTLGLSPSARSLVAYILGLGLLVMGIEIAWRHRVTPALPAPQRETPAIPAAVVAVEAATPEATTSETPASAPHPGNGHRHLLPWLESGLCLLLWLLWVADAMPAFWLITMLVALPIAIRLTDSAINHLLSPPGDATLPADVTAVPSVLEVSLGRGLRTLLIICAALLLAKAWHLDLGEMTSRDTLATRILRGGFSAIVIALAAEFLWVFMRAVIDSRLTAQSQAGQPDTEETRRQARLRTLLPILRNMLFIVILVIAGLMILSAMGIEIGPLIAGAGVVGVAIGFGAQTLVKDVISGMFYLLDDAFRIGEYIQSGNYKGTVESFSLRSVKLRHHRGPLYTVPFGVLGAIQNMSRDWVIDKLMIGVTYDTDLDLARKLIKEIGKQLQADPECAPHILEPLKMQGVEAFGDYAIQIRMKMMTKPGEQFVIRRKALALINKAFKANGISFASPTVQVAGGGDHAAAAAAAAQQSIDRATAKLEAEAAAGS
jgi:small-conductance mechanosensitive channel